MEARRAYFQEYWQKNKTGLNERTKSYQKAVKKGEISVKKRGEDHTIKDVWNVRRSKDCFEYPELYIKFMQPIVRGG